MSTYLPLGTVTLVTPFVVSKMASFSATYTKKLKDLTTKINNTSYGVSFSINNNVLWKLHNKISTIITKKALKYKTLNHSE